MLPKKYTKFSQIVRNTCTYLVDKIDKNEKNAF